MADVKREPGSLPGQRRAGYGPPQVAVLERLSSRRMDKVLAVRLTLFLVGVCPAFAEAAPAASADDLMSQGLRLRRDGKDQEALPIFEEASRQQPTPRAFAQLGLCEQALGLWVGAERHIQMALGAGDDPWVHKHEITLRESLKVVQDHLGSVEVWGTPTGARV